MLHPSVSSFFKESPWFSVNSGEKPRWGRKEHPVHKASSLWTQKLRDAWWKNPSIDPHIQIYIYFLCTYEPSRLPFPNQSYGAYMASNFIVITTFSDNGSLSSIMLNVVPYVANHLEVGQLIVLLPNTPTPTTMVPSLYQKLRAPQIWIPSHTTYGCLSSYCHTPTTYRCLSYFPTPISWVKTDFFRTETDEQKEGEKRNKDEKKKEQRTIHMLKTTSPQCEF